MSKFEKLLADMRAQREIFRKQSKKAKEAFNAMEASILLQKTSLLTVWIDELESAIVRSTSVVGQDLCAVDQRDDADGVESVVMPKCNGGMLILDCSNATEYRDLIKHCWIGFDSITIGGLMHVNRNTGGDTLDVLLGLIDAGIELTEHLDWKVKARIVNSSNPPTLEKDGDNWKAIFIEDLRCVALILRVEKADGGLVTYLTPRDVDGFTQATWVPSWKCMSA